MCDVDNNNVKIFLLKNKQLFNLLNLNTYFMKINSVNSFINQHDYFHLVYHVQ
jgi:hypothetical protein